MRLLLAVLILGAVGVAVGDGGGFDATPQWAFAATAGAAALVAFVWRPARALRLLRSPPVAILLALGALSALSAAWTIASVGGALQAGALAAGYGCLALATGVLARPAEDIAVVIAATAVVTAISGLVSVALLSGQFAERIAHVWQPEGPFGYAPALALVQVGALPLLLRTMLRGRIVLACLAFAAAALAIAVVVLSASRISVALAGLVVVLAILFPRETAGGRRRDVFAAAVFLGAGGFGVHVAFGGHTPLAADGGAGRVLLLLVVVGASATAWGLYRHLVDRRAGASAEHRLPRWAALAAAAAAVVVAVLAGLLSASSLGNRTASHGSFTHGRIDLYHISFNTFVDRPGQGYGAGPGAFLSATLVRQASRQRVTIFAHNLPLELAVGIGIVGLLLGIALYVAVGLRLWTAHGSPALWLLGPIVAAFLVSNLVDWTWHLAGVGALFALALGALSLL